MMKNRKKLFFKKRKIMFVIFIIVVCVFLNLINLHENKQNYNNKFTAKWIWSNDNEEAGQWTNFRKKFVLSELPEKAETYISVDSKYWLWINGKMVVFEGMLKNGPNKEDMYYDTIDIAKYLKKGENVISVQVVYFGKDGYSSRSIEKPGFLFQSLLQGKNLKKEIKIISDSSWKAIKNEAYKQNEIESNYRLVEPNILYDANLEMNGWNELNFDDTNWKKAKIQADAGKKPFGNLVERPIPQFKVDDIIKYTKDGKDNTKIYKIEEDYEKDIDRYIIRNVTNIQGTMYLKVNSKSGNKIEMYTDTWKELAGNGDSIRHAYITKDGIQEFEALGWVNGYDVYFEIPKEVEVLELGFRPSGYNTKEVGRFICDDDELNILYRKSYDTLYVTMRDNYMDCPDRERTQWIGDAVNEMQMAFYCMDSNARYLYKKTLNQTIEWSSELGEIPTRVPCKVDEMAELPMQSLAGVHSFWLYYMYSGDSQPMQDGYDCLMKYLKLWNVDSDGFVKHREGNWDWMDWGSNADGKIIEQSWYYIALKSMKNIALTLKKPSSDIDFLEKRMEGIEENFDRIFWNEEKKAYYSNTDSNEADDRANALAVYSGLALESRYNDIKELLKYKMEASPYMEKYVLQALYMMGFEKEAMSRTKERYSEMINDDFPTLWEFWDKNKGTRNHAWSGGPLTMMYMYQIGITPLSAAYETFQIRPQLGTLKNIEAIVPSPQGDISSKIQIDENKLSMEIKIPNNIKSADIYIPKLNSEEFKIILNQKLLYDSTKSNKVLNLENVKFKDENEKYIIFTILEGGTYTFNNISI